MQKYSCLIIEDEPLASEILTDYIQNVPFLKLIGSCRDAFFGMEVLRQQQVDLIFLDIHLPKMKGLDFIKVLKNPPSIIITSAYQEYALQAYEFNVIDYLLKPIEFERFLMAVNKLDKDKEIVSHLPVLPSSPERQYIFFNVGKKKVKMYLDEIQYIESLREYIKVTTKTKSVLTKFKLSDIEKLLTENNFIRVHRSFIVSKDKIESISATEAEVGGKYFPIGRIYKKLVTRLLENNDDHRY